MKNSFSVLLYSLACFFLMTSASIANDSPTSLRCDRSFEDSFHTETVLNTAVNTHNETAYKQMSAFTFSLTSLRLEGEGKDSWMSSHSTVGLSTISLNLNPISINESVNAGTYYAVVVDSSGVIQGMSANGFQLSDSSVVLDLDMMISTEGSYSVHFVSTSTSANAHGWETSTYDQLMADMAQANGSLLTWNDSYDIHSWASPNLNCSTYYNGSGSYDENGNLVDDYNKLLSEDKGFFVNGVNGHDNGYASSPSISMTIHHNPEPSSALLSVVGLMGMLLRRKVRNN